MDTPLTANGSSSSDVELNATDVKTGSPHPSGPPPPPRFAQSTGAPSPPSLPSTLSSISVYCTKVRQYLLPSSYHVDSSTSTSTSFFSFLGDFSSLSDSEDPIAKSNARRANLALYIYNTLMTLTTLTSLTSINNNISDGNNNYTNNNYNNYNKDDASTAAIANVVKMLSVLSGQVSTQEMRGKERKGRKRKE